MSTATKQEAKTTETKTGFVYIQEGGSSGELYLHSFDQRSDAENGAKSCGESSYRTSPIIEVPLELLDHPQFHSVVEGLLAGLTDLEYAG